MKKELSLLALLILFKAATVLAQTGALQGKVIDETTLEPLPFANITAEDTNNIITGTQTDTDGNYTLKTLRPGKYTVKVIYLGYETKVVKDVNISADQTNFLDFKLKTTSVKLATFEVVDYKAPLISKDAMTSGASVHADGMKMDYRGSSSESSESRIRGARANVYEITPGQLTASELNDFSKWQLWQDIKEHDLKKYGQFWGISPQSRYSVQVRANDGSPVADAKVLLKSPQGKIIWEARTDNTGKAELWNNLFPGSKNRTPDIVVVYEGIEYPFKDPQLFTEGINALKLPVECNNPTLVDIAFVVDATGSMADEMEYLKVELNDIISSVKENQKELTYRVGSVFYRDIGDEFLTRKSDFSSDIKQTLSFMELQSASGGDDYPEAVEEALKESVENMEWTDHARARLLFLLLDAPPHAKPEVIEKMQKNIQKASQKGIRIIPVIASGDMSEDVYGLEYLMRSMALATNGTYVFLTDHSHIGETHAIPVTDQYDVELVNNLIKRLINQYTYMPACGDSLAVAGVSDTSFISSSPVIAHEIIDSSRTYTDFPPQLILRDYTKTDTTTSVVDTVSRDTLVSPHISEPEPLPLVEIKFYPNPTSGMITVEIRGEVEVMYITDISGKLIQRLDTKGKSLVNSDLGSYSSGIYFLKFIDHSRPYTGKIVLAR